MTSHKYTNKLIEESSPYLLQHAHNPVNWYPWGEEALEKARRENKPIIVSVGYSACHWCHVMEKESFENEAVARIMNEKFISIKVDREERPDIDQVYMNAVQLINGSGGWPLNCIALPDGRPVYGGTYFPRENWMGILTHVHAFIKDSPDKAEEQARALTEGVKGSEELIGIRSEKSFEESDIETIFRNWIGNLDYVEGGHKGAPKFPLPVGFRFLLRLNDEKAQEAVDVTLSKMAMGGIYDQIGGGFARYATDDRWIVPHFEKMLYDNAQLVTLYSEAYQKTKKELYREVVEETLSFIKREMTSPDGGFYSAFDADSEGVEGAFYTWKESDLRGILEDAIGINNTDLVLQYYSVLKNGNWEEETNILYRSASDEAFALKHGTFENELSELLQKAKRVIFEKRKERIHPGLDDKILTGWNGLMLKGCVDAYRVFGDQKYLDMALQNANFIKDKVMDSDYRLFRNYKNKKATINGFLDDYAFTVEGFTALYQATFDEKWIDIALKLTEYAVDHFYDDKTGMFFYTSDLDKKLIARKKEISDNVIPASNSQMAINLYLLGDYYGRSDFTSKAIDMAAFVKETALRSGAYLANWDILILYLVRGLNNIAILGENAEKFRKEFDEHFLPNAVFSGGINEGDLPVLKNRLVSGATKIYVCRDRVCKLPQNNPQEALEIIKL